jgi:hypothetical protein
METPVTNWIVEAFERRRDKAEDSGRLAGIEREDEIQRRKREFEQHLVERFAEQLCGFEELEAAEQATRIETIRNTVELGNQAAGEYSDSSSRIQKQQARRKRQEAKNAFESLVDMAVDAKARLLGLAPRPKGYARATKQGKDLSRFALMLAAIVGFIEAIGGTLFFEKRVPLLLTWLPSWAATLAGFVCSVVFTVLVMTVTWQAAVQTGETVRERRGGRKVSYGLPVALTLLAAVLQAVFLGMRMAEESGSEALAGVLMLLAVMSFIGAAGVFVLEMISSSRGVIVDDDVAELGAQTVDTDSALIERFRSVEMTYEYTSKNDWNTLECLGLEQVKTVLKALIPATKAAGTLSAERLINAEVAKLDREIADLRNQDVAYDQVDLAKKARARFGAQEPIVTVDGDDFDDFERYLQAQ